MKLRREPWKGLWQDERFRRLMNTMGFDVVDGLVLPLGEAHEP
ncbi:MAG TPA: hypothetical protein VLA36_16660 [Longimicrobiales bacterium]|nr:hypothetical protein [Longimicrobiales bacterium]